MAPTKRDLLRLRSLSHQQAIVETRQQIVASTPIRKTIPGGAMLLQQIGKDNMDSAVLNWLRGCYRFSKVTLSFAKDPGKYNLKKEKYFDFDSKDKEAWEIHPDGKTYLAEKISRIIKTQKFVYLEADKEGIFVYSDQDNNFKPTKQLADSDIQELKTLIEEAKLEAIAAGEDPKAYDIEVPKVGTEVPSDEWEPYIEFVPKSRKQFGR